jgi:hypothetical protein
VVPKDLQVAETTTAGAWSAFATGVTPSGTGTVRIDLAVRNDTGDWSAMTATDGKPAVLAANGASVDCETVFVGTGGHRLAPGFQMRGYTAGTESSPEVQLIYVECPGNELGAGATLRLDYWYVTGQYNYYEQDKNRIDTQLQIDLGAPVADASYPNAQAAPESIYKQDAEILALNKVTVRLTSAERTDAGIKFTWHTANPGEYPSYVHIGNPPVIGDDGILYGFYETPDIVSVPLTPAGGEMEWTTQVAVPPDVRGLYIMLSVETGKARLFANYAVDITDK